MSRHRAMECVRLSHLILLIAIALVLFVSIAPCDANFNPMPEGKRRAKHKLLGDERKTPPPYHKPPEGRRRQRVEVTELCSYNDCLLIPYW